MMKKGLGFYSPHESTLLLLKIILVSMWLGIDLISTLIISTFPPEVFMSHGLAILFVLIILFSGTIFSLLLAWSTGVLFESKFDSNVAPPGKNGILQKTLLDLKQDNIKFLAAGFTGIAVCMFVTLAWIAYARYKETWTPQKLYTDPAIYKKCTEVAELEGGLFNKSKQATIEECINQYKNKNTKPEETKPESAKSEETKSENPSTSTRKRKKLAHQTR